MNFTPSTRTKNVPWYSVSFVWLLIGIPATSVIVGITMFTLAVRSYDGLVVDDYYQHGKHINQVLARDEAARDYFLRANLFFDLDTGIVSVDLSGETIQQVEKLSLSLIHPTKSGHDQDFFLRRGPDGRFHGNMSKVNQKRWVVQIETPVWRLVGMVDLNASSTMELLPSIAP
ncbi:FixH family protein [Arenicellales bacterium nBUS_48]